MHIVETLLKNSLLPSTRKMKSTRYTDNNLSFATIKAYRIFFFFLFFFYFSFME